MCAKSLRCSSVATDSHFCFFLDVVTVPGNLTIKSMAERGTRRCERGGRAGENLGVGTWRSEARRAAMPKEPGSRWRGYHSVLSRFGKRRQRGRGWRPSLGLVRREDPTRRRVSRPGSLRGPPAGPIRKAPTTHPQFPDPQSARSPSPPLSEVSHETETPQPHSDSPCACHGHGSRNQPPVVLVTGSPVTSSLGWVLLCLYRHGLSRWVPVSFFSVLCSVLCCAVYILSIR